MINTNKTKATETAQERCDRYYAIGLELFKENKITTTQLGIQERLVFDELMGAYNPERDVLIISSDGVQRVASNYKLNDVNLLKAMIAHELGHAADKQLTKLNSKKIRQAIALEDAIEHGRVKGLYHVAHLKRLINKIELNAYKYGLKYVDEQTLPTYTLLKELNEEFYNVALNKLIASITSSITEHTNRRIEKYR